MSQMNATPQISPNKILNQLQVIIEYAEELITLEKQHHLEKADSEAETLNQYVEKKKVILERLTELFQGGQWQVAIESVSENSSTDMQRDILEKKTEMTERFREAMLLHEQAMSTIKQQYDAALTGIEDVQKTKQYLDTHHAMRQKNQRIDITQ